MLWQRNWAFRAASALLAACAVIGCGSAFAETGEVRIAQLYGLPYLPAYVVYEQGLVEKHAQRIGLAPPKVTPHKMTSGPAANDALLAGNVDIAMGGVAVLATLWDKTRGRQNVRGLASLCDTPILLVTAEPRIKTIRDFTESDRIAVSGVKVTVQAIFLQMAAAKEFGFENRFKLDPLAIGMSHPDSITALLSSHSAVRSYAALVPYNFEVMKSGAVRRILSSYDTLGGAHTTTVIWAAESWVKDNPKTYEAVFAAFEEAMQVIKADPQAAARIYRKWEATSLSEDELTGIIKDDAYLTFSTVPKRTIALTDFMHQLGTIKTKPAVWTELFFDRMHAKGGS